MAEDPAIRALFGPAPANVDLTASAVAVNNAAVVAMLVLAAVAVMLRFTARLVLGNALMADDWAIIAALVSVMRLRLSTSSDSMFLALHRCHDWVKHRG